MAGVEPLLRRGKCRAETVCSKLGYLRLCSDRAAPQTHSSKTFGKMLIIHHSVQSKSLEVQE